MKNKPKEQVLIHKCIETKTAQEFINSLPPNVHILVLRWEVDYLKSWGHIDIPKSLVKRGVSSARQSAERTNLSGVLEGLKKAEMLDNLEFITKHYNVPLNKVYIRNVILSDGKAQITLRRTMKNVRLPNDKRKKLRVLGMYNQNGKIQHNVSPSSICFSLLKKLHAFDVNCRIITETSQSVICSTVKHD